MAPPTPAHQARPDPAMPCWPISSTSACRLRRPALAGHATAAPPRRKSTRNSRPSKGSPPRTRSEIRVRLYAGFSTTPPAPVPITSSPYPAASGRPAKSQHMIISLVPEAMFARMSRYTPAPPGTGSPGLPYSPARHNMARHDAPLAQLAEQQTLNLRVRGSSPWRRTLPELGFCYPFTLVGGRFRAMVAPRLLVSPNIVDHGGRTPGETPADGYTQRDIWRKGAGRLAADAGAGCPAGAIGSLHGWLVRLVRQPGTRQVYVRYTSGPSRSVTANRAGGPRRFRQPPAARQAR